MNPIKNHILGELSQLVGTGRFATVGNVPFVMPGLEIQDIGEISFPINQSQIDLLLQKAKKAPFGKGMETVYDDHVRKGREIDADHLKFKNPEWQNTIDKILKEVKSALGLEAYEIAAEPYKLLIYEEGDFFLTHKDTEKEKGMFGTLIVSLPSVHSGGELSVRFGGEEVIADFSNLAYRLGYVAFYADCDHEVKPVTSGYRIRLSYNLIQKKSNAHISLQEMRQPIDNLSRIFKEIAAQPLVEPYVILLGHQYTPENFSADKLKLNDRYKAEALLNTAKDAGMYAKLCLVTSYKMGNPTYEDYDSSSDEIDEVFDEWMQIEHWAGDEYPGFESLSIHPDMIAADFDMYEANPLEVENTGYMGNYGPDVEYWYYYGAVMFWTLESLLPLLAKENTKVRLGWVQYFLSKEQKTPQEIEVVNQIIGLDKDNGYNTDKVDYNVVAQWLMETQNREFFQSCALPLLVTYFKKINADHWNSLFNFLGEDISKKILNRLDEEKDIKIAEKIIAIIVLLNENKEEQRLAAFLFDKLLALTQRLGTKEVQKISSESTGRIFQIAEDKENLFGNRVESLSSVLADDLTRNFVNNKLAPLLLSTKYSNRCTQLLLKASVLFLRQRVDDKPEEPRDWSRSMPSTDSDRHIWKALQSFIISPTQSVYDYKAKKELREDMENAIERVTIDLKTETIRKGSPQTLRLTKTQAAYQKAMMEWGEDSVFLKKLTLILG